MTDTVGKRIRAIAAFKGLGDGQELADKFGVSYETLRKWTEGDTAPNRPRQQKIAAVLGVPIVQFMHGIDASDLPDDLPEAEARLVLESASISDAIQIIGDAVSGEMPEVKRSQVAEMLSALVRYQGGDIYRRAVVDLLANPPAPVSAPAAVEVAPAPTNQHNVGVHKDYPTQRYFNPAKAPGTAKGPAPSPATAPSDKDHSKS